jgi:putative transposase
MAWENYKVEQQRLQVVQTYMSKKASMTDICKQYGITPKTAYKWYNRYLEYGEEGLKDLSRSPKNPNKLFTDRQIDLAIDFKLQHRKWGPKKVKVKLEELYPELQWPSATRLYEIFQDYHLVTPRRIKGRVPATSPLGDLANCNDTWSVDFKGWFLTGDGRKCEPITINDCHTRYLIRCVHLGKHSVEYVWPIFDGAFREYGLPNRVRSDNGPPFGSVGAGRLTKLSINLIKAGVIPEWIDPGHPEQNGRHERFHLTLKEEIATPPKSTLALQIQAFEKFSYDYNFERPHEALKMSTPGRNYQASKRTWDGILRSPEYGPLFEVRRIDKGGQIKWRGAHIFVSETLYGEPIGLKMKDAEMIEIYYGPIYLGILDRNNNFTKPQQKGRRQRKS